MILEIQSFSDIITNSSTEIYCSDSNKNLEKTLQELGIDYFIVKNFNDILNVLGYKIVSVFKDPNFIYEVGLGINQTGRYKDECKDLPKLTATGYKHLKNLGYTDQKITEFFDPIYKACGVYGKIYIIYYDHMSLVNLFGSAHKRTAHKFEWLGID
jgi:hypothetical protein